MKILAAVLAGAALAVSSVSAGNDDTFLVRGATVHTMAGKDIPNGSVLVRDGKITGIGENLAVPAGVRVIEAAGMHLYPGIIDSASEVGLSEIGAVRESSDITEIGKFNPQLSAWMAVNPSSEHIPVTRANGITSSIALPDGELITGRASLIHLSGWTTEQMSIQPSAALHINMPVIRTRTFRFPEGVVNTPYDEAKKNYDKQMQELDQFFEDARRYQTAKAANPPGFQPDVKFEAMIPVLEGKIPVLVTAGREREIQAALQFSEKQKLKMILADGREAWKVAPELKRRNIPVVLGPTLVLPDEEDAPYDRPFTTPAELYKQGVLFSFGSYSAQFARNLPYEAAMAVNFGLPHEAALQALTSNAARIWGVDKQLGSIEEGKIADLVLTNGDPMQTQTEIRQMFIAGKSVDLQSKHTQLYEKYKARP